MIEAVVRDIAKTHFPNDPDLSCRDVLNDKNSGYNLQYDKFVLKNWWHYFDLYKRLPDNNDQTKIENDLKKQYPKYYNKDPKQAQKQAQKIIACSYEIKTLTALQLIFRNQSQYVDLPKYIFSYIDNIYTITSEFSAHGRNDKTTDAEGFSPDGWSALLSGMLQIMQWVADKNPNPPSYQN